MPTLTANGVELYYEDSGPVAGGETIVFSHGLLFSGRIFDAQAAHLRERYRVVRYDHRGQGRSQVTADGYDMDTLAEDARALLDQLGIERCHLAGLSMGGFVALRLAARDPARIASLLLIDTAAQAEPARNVPRYRLLNAVVALLGPQAVKRPVMRILFGRPFLGDPARAEERRFWERQLTANPRTITRAVRGVLERAPVPPETLVTIRCPALVLVGEEDRATEPDRAEYLAEHLPRARLVRIPRAGHMATIEEPAAVNTAIDAFLARAAHWSFGGTGAR